MSYYLLSSTAWGWFLDHICQFDKQEFQILDFSREFFHDTFPIQACILLYHSRNPGQFKGTWFSHSILVSFKPVLIHIISNVTDKMRSSIKMITWFKTNIFGLFNSLYHTSSLLYCILNTKLNKNVKILCMGTGVLCIKSQALNPWTCVIQMVRHKALSLKSLQKKSEKRKCPVRELNALCVAINSNKLNFLTGIKPKH